MEKRDVRKEAVHQGWLSKMSAVPHSNIVTDPLGSYTGRPWNVDGIPEEMLEVPVQDADDL